jgi:Dirigent-like protein
MRGLKRIVSPGPIVAMLALVVAMGGMAFALPGHNTVFGDDIVNGQVGSRDIRDHSIGWRDIALANRFLAEDSTSGTAGTNGSGIGAVEAWSGRLEYGNADLGGPPVGQSDGTCIRTAASGYNFECTWTFRLGGRDSITVSGFRHHRYRFRLAIVGGTGRYRFAHGVLLAHTTEAFPNVEWYELRFSRV